jgi:UDP-N-acetylmuramoylalanine--D-glutamate ligase
MAHRIGVLGAGISGIGAALLAQRAGHAVWVSDSGAIAAERKAELQQNNIPFEEGGHAIDRLTSCDIVIKSPGIPRDSALIRTLLDRGIEVIGEIEWAFRHAEGKIIGITGSNGKTTTTGLCHHFLAEAGISAAKVGNVGEGFCHHLVTHTADWYVCEVSSFQLEDIVAFRSDIGILLNITEDHLDRYGYDIDRYAEAKMRLALNMTEADTLIYNAMDPVTLAKISAANIQPRLWSIRTSDLDGPDKVCVTDDIVLDLSRSRLMGRHNQVNVLAAARAALLAGAPPASLQPALESFVNEAHRMEFAGEHNGVRYVNDSKATNVDAVWYALDAVTAPVVWIAGGLDKGNNYEAIRDLVKDKVKALICVGLDNRKLFEAFSTQVNMLKETTAMSEAVRMAASLASPGDTVLLSPACASFDLFRDYRDRGDQFKKAVNELKGV